MRTIGFLLTGLLLWPLTNFQPATLDKEKKHFSFIIPTIKPAFTGTYTNTIDTASLKQSNWYASVINSIEESEYEIKYDPATKNYASPNRKQGLRSFYSAKAFSLLPRNDSVDNWRLELTTKGVYTNNKLIYAPDENAAVAVSGKSIQFNHRNNFTTEYINSKEGVRQNFIIQKEPVSRPKTISLKLEANKDWFVNKVHDREIHFAKETRNGYDKKITYNDLKVWDAHNKELDASFLITDNEVSINVNIMNAVYPITIDPLSSSPVATVNGAAVNNYFGNCVASAGDVNGDGYSDVIVGAPGVSSNRGSLYLYPGSATGISTTPSVTLSGNTAGDQFGFSAASAGDVNGDNYSDVIVGAYGVSSSRGAAYVFLGSSGGLISTPSVTLNGVSNGDRFGYSVAGAGDINADGYSDVIAGATLVAPSSTGAAYLYLGSVAGIPSSPSQTLSGVSVNSSFGFVVAPAGDLNGDVFSDVIIGAPQTAGNAGAAFVYLSNGTLLPGSPSTSLNGISANDFFGINTVCAGDINADGYSDMVVGAYGVSSNIGAAYVYHGAPAGISATPTITLNGFSPTGYFGTGLGCAGDINGDGYSDVIVGAEGVSTSTGAVYLYPGSATGLSATPATTLNGLTTSCSFGYSICSAGDINGDGYSDIFIGAPNLTLNVGAAYTYHGSPDGLSTSPVNTPDDANQANANFGVSVASAGDVNADGYSDVIIGAWRYTDGGNASEGWAFVYHGSATGLPATPNSILDDADQANAFFGEAVACAGDVNGDGYSDVIIGADNYNDAGNNAEGRAFVYHGGPAGLNASPNSILDDANQAFAFFGVSVAGAGDVNGDGYADVIVGAIGMTDGANANEGRAYIYHGSAIGLSTTPDSAPDDADQANAWFGWSVAGAGDVNGDGYSDVIIGALTYDDAGNTDEGRAFVYHGGPSGVGASPNSTPDGANQAFAQFGESVATAGDVNGDGYSDVIIGAKLYDQSGNSDEGSAFVYYGSSTGLSTSPISTPDDADQPGAHFGISVACAGDVNGDGYSDVIIGARYYDDGANSNEGRAFVYYGSSTGLSPAPNSTPDDANQADSDFGYSVACAGDINGDGYSDVIVGAFLYDGGTSNEGQAFVYYGNNNGGLRNNLRLYNVDLVTPIQRANIFEANHFGAGLFAKSSLGRVKARMVWEVKKQGDPFSGSPITNSVAFSGKQSSWSNLGIAGTELKNLVQKVHFENKVRVRVEYDKTTAITGQLYGPWRYPAAYLMGSHGMNSTPLPVKFISFTVTKQTDKALLKWITADETPGIQYEVQHSRDGNNFVPLTTVPGLVLSRNEYEWIHSSPTKGLNFYRIRAIENDKFSYSATRTVSFTAGNELIIYPQPAKTGQLLTLKNNSIRSGQPVKLVLLNSAGQLLWRKEIVPSLDNTIVFMPPALAGGTYWLKAESGDKVLTGKIILIGQ